jgi:hypothetical protein
MVDTDPLNWAYITWNVFEHLVEVDKDGKLVPRLATAWQWLDDHTLEMTLRQGVKFHNGEVLCRDRQANWDENPGYGSRTGRGLLELQTGVAPGIRDPPHGPLRVSEPDGGAMARRSTCIWPIASSVANSAGEKSW